MEDVNKIFGSFLIALTFISVIPVPQKFIPSWDSRGLRWFCPMLAVSGGVFGVLWLGVWVLLSGVEGVSGVLRGFVMMLFTLGLTGGLHLDGLMDTCDAIFSHRDRETRIKILSDTHAGSFAVIGCVVVILAKTLLFSELFALTPNPCTLSLIPAYSRVGMAVLLNVLPFAKSGGVAATLGASRRRGDNFFFAVWVCGLCVAGGVSECVVWVSVLVMWGRLCVRVFGGITGDLLGGFVEVCEVIMLLWMVIERCI